jgi:hypothetical protein
MNVIYEELDSIFDQFHRSHMETMLRHFSAKVTWEYI